MLHRSAPRPPLAVRLARRAEQASAIDGAVDALSPVAERLLASPGRSEALRGMWLGHGLHPLLTDLPLGMFTSATLLDLTGGAGARPAARRLIGWGLLAALPTAVTGLAEWGASTGVGERRVGVLHAAANSLALGLYGASWLGRHGAEQRNARALAIAGGLVAGLGGFLGGHLTEARKVSSRHPAFED